MKNTFGNSLCVTIYGESHGSSIGVVIDGLAAGIEIDADFIASRLTLRRPSGSISTARAEADEFTIESGVFEGRTTGTPVCIRIPNNDTKSGDYAQMARLARPSHADYTAFVKYGGFADYRGGGHFSGRITAGLVAAGAIAISILKSKGIYIGTHIKSCGGISDRDFADYYDDITALSDMPFAVLNDTAREDMIKRIEQVKFEGDSVGGILETAVVGIPAGYGEPWFDTVEGLLSHALFSIPAIKGIEFGAGFAFADMKGSSANDPFVMDSGRVVTKTNNNGGINGGITNGMPIVFRCAVKPTPTISIEQDTVDMVSGENATLAAKGRHDPCIVHRARIVADSVTALVLCDLIAQKKGTDGLL